MTRDDVRRRTDDRPARKRGLSPLVEGLEDRLLLYSTTGSSWTDPQRITFSFVPDGTNIGGTPSNLFATLNAIAPTATWEGLFVQAAAIWEQAANVNLVQVPDNGTPIGAGSYQQGDPNVGDIRIGGMAQSPGQLAFTFLPPPLNGGSDAGDIFFNTSQPFHVNNNYDILTVAIHEMGHALGLGESSVQNSDMYGYYNGIKQSLTSDDAQGVQSLYNSRQSDNFANYYGNSTSSSAANITYLLNPSNGQLAIPSLDILSPTAYEWYKVTVPSTTTGSMVVTMQSTNLSELSPRIQVYNGAVQSLAYATAPNAYGATVSVTIGGVSPGQVYYLRASSANTGPTSGGNYGLLVNFGSGSQPAIAPPNTTIASQPDQGGGTSLERTGPWPWWWGQLPGWGSFDPGVLTKLGSLIGLGDLMLVGPGTSSSGGGFFGLAASALPAAQVNVGLLALTPDPFAAQDAALNLLGQAPAVGTGLQHTSYLVKS